MGRCGLRGAGMGRACGGLVGFDSAKGMSERACEGLGKALGRAERG